MRNVLDNSCREYKCTYLIFSNFFSENRAVYEITSKIMVETETKDDKLAARRVLDK